MTYVDFLVKQGSTNRKAVRFQIVVSYEIKTLSLLVGVSFYIAHVFIEAQ
jgi:hypothetical protein